MRNVMLAVMAVAVAGSAQAQSSDAGVCTADHAGDILLTTVEYKNGYRVEAPWKIVSSKADEAGPVKLVAVVDHIIETNPATRKRQLTPLPGAIEMTFQGQSSRLMLRSAANLWCSTVAKALSARSADTAVRAVDRRVVM